MENRGLLGRRNIHSSTWNADDKPSLRSSSASSTVQTYGARYPGAFIDHERTTDVKIWENDAIAIVSINIGATKNV